MNANAFGVRCRRIEKFRVVSIHDDRGSGNSQEIDDQREPGQEEFKEE